MTTTTLTTTIREGNQRRHFDPRCTCPACLAFDHSLTQPMQCFSANLERVNAFDTETSERFTYYFPQEASHTASRQMSAPPRRCEHTITTSQEQTLRSLLVPTLLQKLQVSIEAHPLLWLCASCVLNCLHIL
jgi:hypothetical protein